LLLGVLGIATVVRQRVDGVRLGSAVRGLGRFVVQRVTGRRLAGVVAGLVAEIQRRVPIESGVVAGLIAEIQGGEAVVPTVGGVHGCVVPSRLWWFCEWLAG